MDAAVVAGAGDVESVSASGTAASRLPLVVAPFSSLLLFVMISVVGQVWASWAIAQQLTHFRIGFFLNIFLRSVFVRMYL